MLALVIAEWIYQRFPDEDEGQLSRRLNSLVARGTCAEVGREIGLRPHLRLGKQARSDGAAERLEDGGMALGMFEGSQYETGRTWLRPDDLLAIYSDGITEAEDPKGQPFDERGLGDVLHAERRNNMAAIGAAVVRAVEVHTNDTRFADDLTLLLLRRSTVPAPAGV